MKATPKLQFESQSTYEWRGSANLWWYNKASDLRGSAAAIWEAIQTDSSAIKEKYNLGSDYRFDVAAPGVFAMNAGLSLELLFKAYWLLTSGKSFEKIPGLGHDLVKLANACNLQNEFNVKQIDLFAILSQYILWVGKYPVARNEEKYDQASEILRKRLTKKDPASKLNFMIADQETSPSWENYDKLWSIIASNYFRLRDE